MEWFIRSERPLANRQAAGDALVQRLRDCRLNSNAIVLALPRGGVPVAYQIAQAMALPLDVLLVRKLGTPGQPELAMGAVASGNVQVLNDDVIRGRQVSASELAAELSQELAELHRREQAYRGSRPWPELRGRQVLLVDDGVATGATMLAAIAAVRQQHPADIIVAIPVAPADTLSKLQTVAEQVICLFSPTPFYAIGQWYVDFNQTSDDDVRSLLAQAWRREATDHARSHDHEQQPR